MIKTVIDSLKRLALIAPLALAACGGNKNLAQPKPGLPPLPPAKVNRPASPIKQIFMLPSAYTELTDCVTRAFKCADGKKEKRPNFSSGDIWDRIAYCKNYVMGCQGGDK